MSKPIIINDSNFDEMVLKNSKTVLVDFYADWCGPCKMLAPILEDVASQIGEDAVVAKINIDQNQEVARKYMVMSIPTMIIFKNGEQAEKIVGLRPAGALIETIKKHI